MTFVEFMAAVDATISNILMGLDSNDIADYAYRDAYDSGATAQETAEEALAASDFPFDDFSEMMDYL